MTIAAETTFEAYLHAIRDLPLLEPAHEQQLFEQIRAGQEAGAQLQSDLPLSASARAHLEQLVARGTQARETVIAAHLRLVIRIARQYTSRGVALLDLIQEGNLGLLHAIDHFDPAVGVRFATYASWWVRHAVGRAVAELGHPVHLPDDVRAKLYRLYRARVNLQQQLAREPRAEELAAAAQIPERELPTLVHYLEPVLSLNAPVGDETDTELADLVPDPEAEVELCAPLQQVLATELERLLHTLPPEERNVLTLRFGLHRHEPHTRQDVAGLLGSTTERVRQLEARALRRLRAPELLDQLRSYVDYAKN